ncbi:MAG: hypothetical protein HXO16_04250, partial [Prevotella salivae]|nr:hypothetical protein [Segatella salivae]
MKMKLFLLPVTMLFAVVTPSKAQTESPFDSVQQIKEVVISTTRIPEMKSNAAASVTIIDHNQIAAMAK